MTTFHNSIVVGTLPIRLHLASRVLLLAATVACMSAATAGTTAAAEATKRYEQERAVCMKGQSNQNRATCMREAGAAYQQARRHGLDDGAAPYARNAVQRCQALAGDDRAACEARMQGHGTISGTAESGGIYRELVVTTPGATPTPQPADATAAPQPVDAAPAR